MFVKISPKEISENPIKLIGQDWMLISAGSPEKFNSMTASWGGIGFMWNKPVAFAVIRPTRYTFEFVESRKRFTLSFFSQNYKKALGIFGSKSGRDCGIRIDALLYRIRRPCLRGGKTNPRLLRHLFPNIG